MPKVNAAARGVKRAQPEASAELQLLDLPTELLSHIAAELTVPAFEVFRSLCHRTRNLVDQDTRCVFWRNQGNTFLDYQLKGRNGAEQLAYLADKVAIAKAAASPATVTSDASVTTVMLEKYDAIFMKHKVKICLKHPELSRLRLNRLRSVTVVDMSAHPYPVSQYLEWDMMPPNVESLDMSLNNLDRWMGGRGAPATLKKVILKENHLRDTDAIELPEHITVLHVSDFPSGQIDQLSALNQLTYLEMTSVSLEQLDCDNLPKSLKTLIVTGETSGMMLSNLHLLESLISLDICNVAVFPVFLLPEKLEILKCNVISTSWNELTFPPSLLKVVITNCRLILIPQNLLNATALQELDLSRNFIFQVSADALPTTVRSLDLSHNGFEKIGNIDRLSNLVNLNLSVTLYGGSPHQIAYPASLRTLNLLRTKGSCVWRHDFPESLQDLKLGNEMRSLSGVVFPCNLRRIFIVDTAITSLDDVSFPDALESLTLTNNKIKSIDQACFPEGLRHLILDNNRIVTLAHPGLPKSLQTLKLVENRIVSISEQSLPTSLVALDLDRNPFIATAYYFDRLINLHRLSLAKTRLYAVEPLRLPPNLRNLILDENKITTLKGLRLPSTMTHLSLCRNRFTSFEWPDLNDGLIKIDLSYCDIASFHDICLKARRVHLVSTKVGSMNGFYIPHGAILDAKGMTVAK